MPKQFFHKWLPSSEKVANLKFMRIFGQHTLNPLLWYVNRRSIAKAMFIGTFWGILPVPFHSLFIILTILWLEALYTTNFIEPLSYQVFSFLKLRALS